MNVVSFNELYANKYIADSINVIVEQAAREYSILKSYADDIKQELWLHVNRARRYYSPSGKASMETFFRQVIEKRMHNVIKKYFSATFINNFNNSSLEAKDVRHVCGKNNIHLVMLKLDVAFVVNHLQPEQKQVCQWIMQGMTLAAIARNLNMSESSFYYSFIYPIRNEFKKENLEKYFDFL